MGYWSAPDQLRGDLEDDRERIPLGKEIGVFMKLVMGPADAKAGTVADCACLEGVVGKHLSEAVHFRDRIEQLGVRQDNGIQGT